MEQINFIIIAKPDAVKRGLVGKILSMYENRKFTLSDMKLFTAPRDIVEKHYSEHKHKHHYGDTVSFILSGPIVVMKFTGNLKIAREIFNNIRTKYSNINAPAENVIHCSDSEKAAKAEVALWFNE